MVLEALREVGIADRDKGGPAEGAEDDEGGERQGAGIERGAGGGGRKVLVCKICPGGCVALSFPASWDSVLLEDVIPPWIRCSFPAFSSA
jgi:hypothetical protein